MSLESQKILGVHRLSNLMLTEGSEQEGQDAVLCNHVFKPGRCFCANDPSRPSIRRQQANGDTAFVQKRGRPALKIQRQLHTSACAQCSKSQGKKLLQETLFLFHVMIMMMMAIMTGSDHADDEDLKK